MRLYLSGPMSGYPEHNIPEFERVAKLWRENTSHIIVVPHENNIEGHGHPWEYYLKRDLKLVLDCEGVLVLPNWERSRGATLEVQVARQIGLGIYKSDILDPLTPYYESGLQEALRIVYGDREHAYGHPGDDFARSAAMWTTLLSDKLRDGAVIESSDIPNCMIAVKLSRACHRYKRDDYVDIAGYAETAIRVYNRSIGLE